jgi:hypothetical protein
MLGDGTGTQNSTMPVGVSGLSGILGVGAGAAAAMHSCAVLSDGAAQCWGSNDYGQLGQDTWNLIASNVPVVVTGLEGATQVSVGGAHSCAVLSDGTARCWGKNASGELGNGTNDDSYLPVAVSGLSGIVAISAGRNHTCAVLSDGSVRCWGQNYEGQLGDDTHAGSNIPVTVLGLNTAVGVALGNRHSCALLGDGSAACWGDNGGGALGNGTSDNSKVPVPVAAW